MLRLPVGQDEKDPRGDQGHRREGDRAYPTIAGTKGAHGAPPCPDVDDGHNNRHGNEERCCVDAQNSAQNCEGHPAPIYVLKAQVAYEIGQDISGLGRQRNCVKGNPNGSVQANDHHKRQADDSQVGRHQPAFVDAVIQELPQESGYTQARHHQEQPHAWCHFAYHKEPGGQH